MNAPMKKLVGCLICRSTTKLTKTNKLPNVVTTMHMAEKKRQRGEHERSQDPSIGNKKADERTTQTR